ncbi:unnamed protein product [Rotaria socialis]|uniref:Uncharacterized protein n=1 Tax=Rotaria socialis TaxID=392032 RepID=A0A817TLR8_9BILA|nr:unnamed protein product [Rotaria socialis]CAF4269882.1 unnamed protein product [Rotaria socialis]
MSSSTATISSKNSTITNNDRKRPISSSMRPSPSPPSAKRHGLSESSSNSRHATNKNSRRSERNEILLKKSNEQNERQSRSKQQFRHRDNKSSSSESSHSSLNSNHSIREENTSKTVQTYNDALKSTMEINGSNQMVSTNKHHLNSMHSSNKKLYRPTDTIYTKKSNKSIALIVKPSTTIDERQVNTTGDSEDEFERTKSMPNNISATSTHVTIPSSVMTIVTATDLSKKSARTESVIIQQHDGNIHPNSSTKLVKVVVPQAAISPSIPPIKMLSSGDGLASALRIPTKIQLTKPLFVSSTKNDKTSSLFSSTSTHSINHRQQTLLHSSSTSSLDIPIDMREKQQQTVVDYHSSTTLPPTPPPPVIDNNNNSNVRTGLSHRSKSQIEGKQKSNEISTMIIKGSEDIDSSTINHNPNHQITSKRHSLQIDYASSLVDWSVPPTSELSPSSLTSSSPDLAQYHLPIDDSLIDLDLAANPKRSIKRRYRSLSSSCPILPSFEISHVQSTERVLTPVKSRSLTGLSNSSMMKCTVIKNKRSLTASPTMKLSSLQRVNKRRRDGENLILNQQNGNIYRSKTKQLKIEDDSHVVIKDLLNDIIDRIVSTQPDTHNTMKTLLHTSIPPVKQAIPFAVLPNRQRKMSHVEKTKAESFFNTILVLPRTNQVDKKRNGSSQSLDSTVHNESRSMIMTQRELDELAYLLHANVHRGQYERIGNPTQVEERMREIWSKMSIHKKKTYYNRVIQIYKRPHHDVVIASPASAIETNSLSSTTSYTDNKNTSSISVDVPFVELKRQTSTPLSFHSVASSVVDEQPIISPVESDSKSNVFTDIVNELITGAKGLDKLSCSPTIFVNSIHKFVRSTLDKQIETVKSLEQQLEKKRPTQLNRATIFWTQKINYFATKYSIKSPNESMNELALIVKYFYLFILSLSSRKQDAEYEATLTNLVQGNLTFIDESFSSSALTSIIEDRILLSSVANDYLASQPIIISDIEHSLPLIRNIELENDYLNKNDTHLQTSPFSDLNDLENYLSRCEHMTITIPCQTIQQSHHPSMCYSTYPPHSQYYYSPTQSSDINNYYYNPTVAYPNTQQMYAYGQPTSYYHPSVTYNNNNNNNNNNNEQLKYYYNSSLQQQQQPSYMYPPQSNSTNDIPLPNNSSHHRTYRQMSSNIQRTYSNSQQPTPSGAASSTPSTPAVFDATTVVSPQSNQMNTTNINNNYPP